jgi:hypothetical protein
MADRTVRCGGCGAERTFCESGVDIDEAIALWEQDHEREAHGGEEVIWEETPNPFYS